jgi:hypothetical protein
MPPVLKATHRVGIEINSAEKRTLGVIHLEIGPVSDSVTVTAASNPVMLGSGERASLLTGAEIGGIALRGRDFVDAVGLLPGVVDTAPSREAPNPSSIDQINLLGARSTSKNATLDGMSILNTGANTTVHIMPSMDTIAEVKVLMSNYSAEYGRSSGGVIMVVTKGGSNQYHGSAGWYYRHEDFSGNDFFNKGNGVLARAIDITSPAIRSGGLCISPASSSGIDPDYSFSSPKNSSINS